MEEPPTSIISIEERKLLLAEKEFEIKKSESEARI